MSDHQTPPSLVILFGTVAATGAVATLYLGVDMLAVQQQPDPHGFRALIKVGQVLILFLVGMTACVGVGAGLGGVAVSTGRSRFAFGALIGLTLVGLGCALAALR